VFHFLTETADRERYIERARTTIVPGGTLIMATFALDGPSQCSGLPVCRYSAETLAATLGPSFTLLEQMHEMHHTPAGIPQSFQWCRFRHGAKQRY
jgi:hypothetical protein